MTLLDQSIHALIAYRKRNGYTRTISPCTHYEYLPYVEGDTLKPCGYCKENTKLVANK